MGCAAFRDLAGAFPLPQPDPSGEDKADKFEWTYFHGLGVAYVELSNQKVKWDDDKLSDADILHDQSCISALSKPYRMPDPIVGVFGLLQ